MTQRGASQQMSITHSPFPARSELAPVDYQARADQVRARVRTRHRHSDTWSNPSASSPVRVVSVHSESIAGKRREHSSQRSTRRSIFAKGYARVLGATDREQPDRTRLRNAWRPPRYRRLAGRLGVGIALGHQLSVSQKATTSRWPTSWPSCAARCCSSRVLPG